MFVPGIEPHVVKKTVDDIRERGLANGRDPSTIKNFTGMLIIVNETDEKANAKYE
jgi:alkanesulfonate monooxygenase SsuD/methylene tetrahydromethanopterin reductase-like flavin-dependent oxidoreductase (luciferase family)